MTTSTLRGIFPEPKPVYRRNFMRENIKNLKEMQGFINENKIVTKSQTLKTPSKYRNVASKVYSNIGAPRRASQLDVKKRPLSHPPPLDKPQKGFFKSQSSSFDRRSVHRGVQTERPEDVPKLYETGVLKYPSHVTQMSIKQQSPRPKERGDSPHLDKAEKVTKKLQNLELDSKQDKQNYIKQNINSIKPKTKKDEPVDPLQPPPGYQKGVVPKYLKEQRSLDTARELEIEGLNGLVLLPDDERREYLRVARENYAALIKELNSMPVSNDTLKKRKRKMEIEDELKRLDEVIKIFQKPKVFVKADA